MYGIDLSAGNCEESYPAGWDARSSGYFLCCNTPHDPLNLPPYLSGTQLEHRIGQQLNSFLWLSQDRCIVCSKSFWTFCMTHKCYCAPKPWMLWLVWWPTWDIACMLSVLYWIFTKMRHVRMKVAERNKTHFWCLYSCHVLLQFLS